jgi:hypothetical protein
MTQRFGSEASIWPLLITTILGISAVSLGIPLQLLAQAKVPSLAFEVVSVRVNTQGQRRELSIQYLPGGRFSARAVPIPLLIGEAYDTARLDASPEFQKLDLSVIERGFYDIEAVAPINAIPPGTSAKVRNEKIREMLQTLLADRFKLRVHHEMKEQSGIRHCDREKWPETSD